VGVFKTAVCVTLFGNSNQLRVNALLCTDGRTDGRTDGQGGPSSIALRLPLQTHDLKCTRNLVTEDLTRIRRLCVCVCVLKQVINLRISIQTDEARQLFELRLKINLLPLSEQSQS
jgi:hypothetical protein